MKKIIAIFAILVCTLFCVNVKADVNYNKIKEEFITLYDWNHKEYFSENEQIKYSVIIGYVGYNVDFEKYTKCEDLIEYENGESWCDTETVNIPANVYEEFLKSKFNIDDEYIEKYIRTNTYMPMGQFEYITTEEGSFYNYTVNYGWGSESGYGIQFLGYKNLDNGYFDVYAYIITDYYCLDDSCDSWEEYEPSENEQENIDYLIIDDIYYRIDGYIKSKMYYDGEIIKYLSFEHINKDDMVSLEGFVLNPTPSISIQKDYMNIYADEDVFPENTEITAEQQTEGNIFDEASKALKEKFASFVIYEINAKVSGEDVEPNGKVEISIKVPEGYQTPVIYYVSKDGELEKLETKVEDGYAVAYVEHFSTYAIVDEKVVEKETIVEKVEQVVDKVVENVVENPKTGIISGVGIVAVAGGCGAYFYNKNKKKNKFPNS